MWQRVRSWERGTEQTRAPYASGQRADLGNAHAALSHDRCSRRYRARTHSSTSSLVHPSPLVPRKREILSHSAPPSLPPSTTEGIIQQSGDGVTGMEHCAQRVSSAQPRALLQLCHATI